MPNGNPTMHASDGVSLKEHFEDLLKEIDKRYEQRFSSQDLATKSALAAAAELAREKERAVMKAEENAEKWRNQANEWRGAMNDKDRFLATKESVKTLEGKIDVLESLRDIASGKASQNSVIGAYVMAAIGILIAIIKAFVK
jgi:hypothetical protein